MPQTLTHNCRTVVGALRVPDRKVDAYKADMDVHQTVAYFSAPRSWGNITTHCPLPIPSRSKSVDKFMSLFCFFAIFVRLIESFLYFAAGQIDDNWREGQTA